jgi:glycosyltransferase involved in cell wall biosynthesis
VDALNALAGLVLRALGRTRRVAFYVIDYTPRRFGNPLLNWVYQSVDRVAATRSDVVWNLSERMRAVRRKQGVPEARNTLVPVGVALDQVKHPPRPKIRRKALLYMGALMDNKGIQLLIEAFPAVLKKVPGAELHIIGFGPFEAETRRLAEASPAAKRIHVPGGMGHEKLFREVPRFGVAFAPYLDDPGSYTWWCDPTKPKEYLACGLPLIITKVPWIWERVADAKRPLGVAIDYDKAQLVAAAVKLLGDQRFYWRCRRNALEFAASLAWDDIYDRAFGVEESAA